MSSGILLKGVFVAIMSGALSWVVLDRYGTENGSENSNPDRQRYLPYISGWILPMYILMMAVFFPGYYGVRIAVQMTLATCFSIFLHISVYYIVLMLVLPLFRRHISSRACAMMWMIPNYLYFTQRLCWSEPAAVIPVPEKLVWVLFFVWLAGFFVAFGRQMISHMVFRRHILKHAVAVTDSTVLELWNNEIERAKISRPKFRLVVSPDVKTPLTIGLFRPMIRVVLPEQHYTPDELTLIFRHEIIHVGRGDVSSKLFLVFCMAMCWFNPLMRIAMHKSAEDLELSCDETVLLESDYNTRQRYANLILHTAGDEHGFTTCLSASASVMRYRLKNIVKPEKRRSGALAVGLVFFILFMSYGYITLAYV